MKIYVPLPERTCTILEPVMRSSWLELEFTVDESQPSVQGVDHSLEARLSTSEGQFAFYGKAFRKLPRFDIPQVAIDRVDSSEQGLIGERVKIDFSTRSLISTALLWTSEGYAGSGSNYSPDDVVVYVSGLIFNFGNDTTLIISASQYEPDISIISEPAAVRNHIAALDHVEYLA